MLKLLLALTLISINTFSWAQSTDEEDAPPSKNAGPLKPGEKPPPPPPEVSAEGKERAKKLCATYTACIKAKPSQGTLCIETALKTSGLVNHLIQANVARDLPRFFRREGFVDLEMTSNSFKSIPEGAILVLDAHDPIMDKKPLCPRMDGSALVKCDGSWVNERRNDLRFHVERGCRTKGIWAQPVLIPQPVKN